MRWNVRAARRNDGFPDYGTYDPARLDLWKQLKVAIWKYDPCPAHAATPCISREALNFISPKYGCSPLFSQAPPPLAAAAAAGSHSDSDDDDPSVLGAQEEDGNLAADLASLRRAEPLNDAEREELRQMLQDSRPSDGTHHRRSQRPAVSRLFSWASRTRGFISEWG